MFEWCNKIHEKCLHDGSSIAIFMSLHFYHGQVLFNKNMSYRKSLFSTF